MEENEIQQNEEDSKIKKKKKIIEMTMLKVNKIKKEYVIKSKKFYAN